LRLQTGPALYSLNSTFMDRDDLAAKRGPMRVRLSPAEATARGIAQGAQVVAFNELGEVSMLAEVTEAVPDGLAVVEGVHWTRDTLDGRNVNALTSQRLTDEAGGSTFYDNRIDVRRAG
jgi:anaerobic selenocysteine-containing dehydrogenase